MSSKYNNQKTLFKPFLKINLMYFLQQIDCPDAADELML